MALKRSESSNSVETLLSTWAINLHEFCKDATDTGTFSTAHTEVGDFADSIFQLVNEKAAMLSLHQLSIPTESSWIPVFPDREWPEDRSHQLSRKDDNEQKQNTVTYVLTPEEYRLQRRTIGFEARVQDFECKNPLESGRPQRTGSLRKLIRIKSERLLKASQRMQIKLYR